MFASFLFSPVGVRITSLLDNDCDRTTARGDRLFIPTVGLENIYPENELQEQTKIKFYSTNVA